MNTWLILLIVYVSLIVGTAFPFLRLFFVKIQLHPAGSAFEESQLFSEEGKKRLAQNYSRILGTLLFWKNQAERYKLFHYYCSGWTISSGIIISVLAQNISTDPYSKALLTVVSLHTSILLTLYKAFNVEENFRAFRQGESEFYDTYRRLLDDPTAFGKDEAEQLKNYFEQVETIRKTVRNAETSNLPGIDKTKI